MTNRNDVILSKAKDLKVYVTVDGPTLREMLRYAQHDRKKRNDVKTSGQKDENDKTII